MSVHRDVGLMPLDEVDQEIRWIAGVSSHKWTPAMADRIFALRLRRQTICETRGVMAWRS